MKKLLGSDAFNNCFVNIGRNIKNNLILKDYTENHGKISIINEKF